MNSKRQFDGSFKLHVEFKIPFMPEARGQGRGNSGVYLPNGDEIQVLDSFGMTTTRAAAAAGSTPTRTPTPSTSSRWPRSRRSSGRPTTSSTASQKKDGKPAGKPRVTVVHNGIKIHDNVELQRCRPAWADSTSRTTATRSSTATSGSCRWRRSNAAESCQPSAISDQP